MQHSEQKRKYNRKEIRGTKWKKSNMTQIIGVRGIEEIEWGRGNMWREKVWEIFWSDKKYQLQIHETKIE